MADNNYGLRSLKKDFPTDDKILDFIFDARHSRECSCGGTYRRLKGRRQFQCSQCRFQIAPMAGTIFHKSDTPLVLWFHAIMVFSNAKSGISAKMMQRELEVTYKTAWRILHKIREALNQPNDKMKGDVEVDAGYIGGVSKVHKRMKNKSTVIAAIERKGGTRAYVMPDASSEAHRAFINLNIDPKESRLITDYAGHYKNSAKGYHHRVINHGKEYARGDIHINHVENFWSHVKRSIRGTYKHVSAQHLQSYLDAFVFHANNRRSDKERFAVLLGTLLSA